MGMNLEPGVPVHVFNRTNGRRIAFPVAKNYFYFIAKLKAEVAGRTSIIACCLMPTHFRLLLVPKADGHRLNFALGVVLRSYTRALQKQDRFTGSLFQQGTRARPVEDSADACIHYIHLNPVRARLTSTVCEWPYSSNHEYAGAHSGICDVSLGRELFELPDDPNELVEMYVQMALSQ
jgi:putative transposase